MKNDFVFFWGGTFSQWCPSKFTINNIEYNCAEQYMMAKKALLFRDKESYEKIMSSKDPSYQKQIAMAASYSMLTGCTVKIVKNLDFLLENAVKEMVDLLR